MPGSPPAAFTAVSNDRQIEAKAGPIVTEDLIFTRRTLAGLGPITRSLRAPR